MCYVAAPHSDGTLALESWTVTGAKKAAPKARMPEGTRDGATRGRGTGGRMAGVNRLVMCGCWLAQAARAAVAAAAPRVAGTEFRLARARVRGG